MMNTDNDNNNKNSNNDNNNDNDYNNNDLRMSLITLILFAYLSAVVHTLYVCPPEFYDTIKLPNIKEKCICYRRQHGCTIRV
jgi:hypothetical protein